MGGFFSCFHVPDSHCFCPGCLFHKLKNKPANVHTQRERNDVSSPNGPATSTNPLNTTPAASRPNDVAVSSIASSMQQDGESLQVQPDPFPQSDVHIDIKSVQGRFKSYVKALPSGADSFKHMFPKSDDADECPTCLEEYTTENPKIVAKCNHHYHLSCIYEWMERNENCPICGKLMLFDE